MKEKWSRGKGEEGETTPTITPHYSPTTPLHLSNLTTPPDVTSQQ